MMTYLHRTCLRWLVGLGLLTGCGGDGGSDPAPTPEGTVAVWAKGFGADSGLPLAVFVDGQSVGQLMTAEPATATQAPASGNSVVRVTRAPGTYAVRVTSQLGQVWLYSLTVTPGQTVAQAVDASGAGTLSFGHGGTNTALYPITVVLDGGDTLGVLLGASAGPACNAIGTVTRLRPVDTYRYVALSANRACLWSGTVAATAGACAAVSLPACN